MLLSIPCISFFSFSRWRPSSPFVFCNCVVVLGGRVANRFSPIDRVATRDTRRRSRGGEVPMTASTGLPRGRWGGEAYLDGGNGHPRGCGV